MQVRAEARQRGAKKLRRHNGDNDVGGRDRAVVAGYRDRRWKRKARQELEVFPGVDDFFCGLGAVRPDCDRAAVARQGEGNGGPPGSRAEHRDPGCNRENCHAVLAAPKRCSLPASKRRMLGWCLTMMSRATAACTAIKKAGRSPLTMNQG